MQRNNQLPMGIRMNENTLARLMNNLNKLMTAVVQALRV